MTIEAINYPNAMVRLSSGDLIAINVEIIKGSKRVGCAIEKCEGGYVVVGNNADPDCVGGVCPIK